MNIHEFVSKFKQGKDIIEFDERGEIVSPLWQRQLYLAIVIILVASLSFGIGRITVLTNREPIKIEYDPSVSNAQFLISNFQSIINEDSLKNEKLKIENSFNTASVYASSKGTRYYFTHCKSSVSEKNKITFDSEATAEAAGYTLALNCKPK